MSLCLSFSHVHIYFCYSLYDILFEQLSLLFCFFAIVKYYICFHMWFFCSVYIVILLLIICICFIFVFPPCTCTHLLRWLLCLIAGFMALPGTHGPLGVFSGHPRGFILGCVSCASHGLASLGLHMHLLGCIPSNPRCNTHTVWRRPCDIWSHCEHCARWLHGCPGIVWVMTPWLNMVQVSELHCNCTSPLATWHKRVFFIGPHNPYINRTNHPISWTT